MANKRKEFSLEFKAEAVQPVVQGERPVARVARELEINQSTLGYRTPVVVHAEWRERVALAA